MSSRIEVTFHGTPPDRSLEATVDRWVCRLEGMMSVEIDTVAAIIEREGRQTMVSVSLALTNGMTVTEATEHVDGYVAVSNAFRDLRRALTADMRAASPARSFGSMPTRNHNWTWLGQWWRQ